MKIRKFQIFSIFSIAVVFMAITAAAQERVAVFPFRNMDGQMEYNIWRERLSDSLTIALQQEDMEYKAFYIVPSDSVAEILAAMNLDPNNPQYESDKWKAATQLNVSRVITGNFNRESLELKQSAAPPTLTATVTPQPSATPVALLTLPAPATPVATVPPAAPTQNASVSFWLVAGLVVLGVLVIVGLILWLMSRSRR